MAFDYIAQHLEERRSVSLLRERILLGDVTSRALVYQGRPYLNFASNDYLALGDTSIDDAGAVHLGSHSSSLVTGYQTAHRALEDWLCTQLGYQGALLFNSGFSANSSVLTALFQEPKTGGLSAIFSDKLNHASLIDGALHSKAQSVRFNHNDMNHLRSRLEKSKAVNKLIVSEGVFSMDGDRAPVSELNRLAKQHNGWLMLDDAHGFGVCGEHGLGTGFDIKPDILVITFGKAVASSGACVLASQSTIDYLLQFSREYIYSTAMSPMLANQTLARLKALYSADDKREKLNQNIAYFRAECARLGLPLMESDTAIQPLVLGDAQTTVACANQLRKNGIWLSAIRPPTVPHNTSRLRITLTAGHTHQDIQTLITRLGELL